MKKVYLAQLERFGYTLTAIGRTEEEARDAIIKDYKRIYKEWNNVDPGKDFTSDNRSYLQIAEDELFVEEVELGKTVLWL